MHADAADFQVHEKERKKSMKTVLSNTKRFLAAFMALALILLSLPETAMTVKATPISGEAKATVSIAPNATYYKVTNNGEEKASVELESASETTFIAKLNDDVKASHVISDFAFDGTGAEGTKKTKANVSMSSGDGAYTFAFTPDVAGTYTITPTVSALPVIALSQTPEAGHYTLTGVTAGETTVGEKSITVAAEDGYTIATVKVNDGETDVVNETAAGTYTFNTAYDKTYTISVSATKDAVAPTTTYDLTLNTTGAQIDDVELYAGTVVADNNITTKKVIESGADLKILVKTKDHYVLDNVSYKATGSTGNGTVVEKTEGKYATSKVDGKTAYYEVTIPTSGISANTTITLATTPAQYEITLNSTALENYTLKPAASGSGITAVTTGTAPDEGTTYYATYNTAIKFSLEAGAEVADDVLTNVKYTVGASETATADGLTGPDSKGVYTLAASKVTGAIELTGTSNAPLKVEITPENATVVDNPAVSKWIYGKDLVFTYKHTSAYSDFVVGAKIGDNELDLSDMVESKTSTTQSKFTIPWSVIETWVAAKPANTLTSDTQVDISVEAVEAQTVTFKDLAGKHVTKTGASIVAYGTAYEFTLKPETGYQIKTELETAVGTANTAAVDDDVFDDMSFYAIVSGRTNKTALTIYPIAVELKDDGSLTGKITGLVGKNGGVIHDIDIYIGTAAETATYAVTLNKDEQTLVSNATAFTGEGQYAKATYNTKYDFKITAKQTEDTYKLSSVKYAYAADLTKEGITDDEVAAIWASAKTATGTLDANGQGGTFSIAGSEIKGAIVLKPVIYKEVETKVSIELSSPLTAANTSYEVYRDGEKTEASQPKFRTGMTLQLVVTTDGTVRVDEENLIADNAAAWDITEDSIVKSGNTWTITGKVLSEDAETTITVKGVDLATFTIKTEGKTTAITDLQIATAKDSSDKWVYENYTGAVKLDKDSETKLSYRYKVKDNYDVTGATVTKAANGYYYPNDDVALSADVTITLTAAIANGLMRTAYVYNSDPANITRWSMKTLDSNTKDELEYIEAVKASGSKLNGIRKHNGSETNFDVVQDSKNIVITGTVASKDLKAIASIQTVVEGEAVENLVDVRKLAQTGTTFTLTLTKAEVADGATIILATERDDAASIIVYSSGKGGTAAYEVKAKIGDAELTAVEEEALDGTAKVLADAENTVAQYKAKIGEKITFTITPKVGYTIAAAGLLNLDTDRTTNVAVQTKNNVRTVTTTVTALEGTEQALIIVANPNLAADAITGAGVTAVKNNDPKTAYDGTRATTVSTYSYEGLTSGTAYTVGATEGTATKTGLSAVTVLNGTTEIENAGAVTDADAGTGTITIPATAANKALKVRLTYADGTTFDAYTVKTNTALTKATISGVSKNAAAIEIGTQKLYNITGLDSGASYNDLKVEITATDAADEDTTVPETVSAKLVNGNKQLQVYTTAAIPNGTTIKIALMNGDKALGDNSWFILTTSASNVTGATPTVAQETKTTTSEDLGLKLSLPSKVNANTLKNLINDTATSEKDYLAYKVETKDNDEETATTTTTYFLATAASQSVVIEDVATGTAAKDIDVTVTLLLTEPITAADALELDGASTTTVEMIEANAGTAEKKTFKTRGVSYPTALTVRATMPTLYAGKLYTADAAFVPAGDAAGVIDEAIEFTKIGTVTTDANAVYLKDQVFEIEDVSANPITINREALTFTSKVTAENVSEVIPTFVKDGVIYASTDALNTALAENMIDSIAAVQEIKVIAPRPDTAAQEVSATLKLKADQLAVQGNVQEAPDSKLTITKKAGTAASTQLSIYYATAADAANYYSDFYGKTITKAASNRWTWRVNADPEEATISPTGKLTINKDVTFDEQGLESGLVYHVYAFSQNQGGIYLGQNNPANIPPIYLEWIVTVKAAETVQTEGELVIGVYEENETAGNPGTIHVIAQKGAKFTPASFYDAIDNTHVDDGVPQLFLLEKGAVIDVNGQVSENYVIKDDLIAPTSSNTKVAAIYNGIVELTGQATGSVTFSATGPYSGTKKTLAITIQPNTTLSVKNADGTTTKTYFSLAYGTWNNSTFTPIANATDLDKSRADFLGRKATLTVDVNTVPSVLTLQVMKGEYTVNGKNNVQSDAQKGAVGPADDFYTAAALKAGANVKVLTDRSNVGTGYYVVEMYGKTGTVTVNGVTYTITNTARQGGVAGTVRQTNTVYGDYGFAQTANITYTKGKDIKTAASVVLTPDTDTKVAIASEEFLSKVTGFDAETSEVTLTVSNGSFSIPLKASTLLTDGEDNTLTSGSYTMYATFLDIDDNETADPLKITVKLTKAPTFTPAKSYDVAVAAGNGEFRLMTSNKKYAVVDENYPIITGIENLNTKGTLNNFVSLVASSGENKDAAGALQNGSVQLVAGAALLGAAKTDLTGIVHFTADNGKTFQTAQVTLVLNAASTFYKDQLETALGTYQGADTSTWSAEDTTPAKAKTKIESLVAVPTNITLAWDTTAAGKFTYNGKDAIESLNNEETQDDLDITITGRLKITDKTKKTADQYIDLTADGKAIQIAPKTVTVSTSGIGSAVFNVTDAANSNVDVTRDSLGETAAPTVVVPNGATLSVKKLTDHSGYKADTYYVVKTKADGTADGTAENKKSGAWKLGTIKTADEGTAVITAMNTVTVTRDKNVATISAVYTPGVGAELQDYEVIPATARTISVKSGTDVAFKATTAQGYDVALSEKVGTGKAGAKIVKTTTEDGVTAAEYSKETTHVVNETDTPDLTAKVMEARTYAFTTQAHIYALTVNISGASDVYSAAQTATGGAVTEMKVPAEYGKVAKLRLVKKGVVVGKAKGNYTVTYATAGSPKSAGATATEARDYSTVTTKGVVDGDATLTVTAAQNIGVTFDATGALKGSISKPMISIDGAKATAYSREVAVPAGTKYELTYVVKSGYTDTVTEKVGSEDASAATVDRESSPYTITVDAGTTADTVYTVKTKKATVIGQVVGGTGAAVTVDTDLTDYFEGGAFTYAHKSKTSNQTYPGVSLSTEGIALNGTLNAEAEIGDTLTLTVQTKAGYDLQVLTVAAANGAKTTIKETAIPKNGVLASDKLYCTGEADGVKTWYYTTTVKDAVAAIQFQPVAQARTATIKSLVGTNVSNIGWTVDSKRTANTAIKGYYNGTVTIDYTMKKGTIGKLTLSSTKGAEPTFVKVVTNSNGTKTYTYTVALSADSAADAVAYTIVSAAEEPTAD